MKFTIEDMPPLTIEENGKKTSYKGYAFMDESNHCIIIRYGERDRDAMAEYLRSKDDPLGIKYQIIKLCPKQE
jgi:hypothetical protein